MCLLTFIPENEIPTKRQLENASCNNPHGFGYAMIIDGELIVNKSMNSDELIKDFISMKKKHPEAVALYHCRYSTHGTSTVDNCHPFYIGNDTLTVLAHNGILDIPTFDNRSDTRTFAEDLYPSYNNVGGIDNPAVFKAIEQWAVGSKIIILTVNPKYKYNVYILNEKLGHWKKNIWWSNYAYEDKQKNYYSTSYMPPVSEDYVGMCPNCFEQLTYDDTENGLCDYCSYCFYCDSSDDCLCYSPEVVEEKEYSF